MFEKDENKPRRFWPWGRKDEQAEETSEAQETEATTSPSEPEPVEDPAASQKEKPAARRFWPWSKKEDDQPEAAAEETVQAEEQPAIAPAGAKPESVADKPADSSAEAASEQPEPAQPAVAEPKVEPAQSKVKPEKAPEAAPAQAEVKAEPAPVIEAAAEAKSDSAEPSPEPVAPLAEDKVAENKVAESKAAEEAPAPQPETATELEVETAPVEEPAEEESKVGNFFGRMKQGLTKTRTALVEGVATLMLGKKEIDDELLEDLETQLLTSDVGIEATSEIINELTRRITRNELDDADALITALKDELAHILEPANKPLIIPESKTPFVILVVGVNGVGKTTTIGKLARRLQGEGKKVMLAAGDTFRAAAVEQLQVWGERNDIPVVAQHTGADSASVIYDAFEAAKARQMDVLIADTAGRLHNKDNLMEELKKVKRVLGKIDPEAPHEVLLVLDAGTGQNALSQAKLFNEAVQLTGLALTKLDGTAKGGVIFALSKQMQTPIRFLGVGEQIEDLRPFDANEFVEALFDTSKS